MEVFIAFFDILGFKEIVNNNNLVELKSLFDHLLRDTQTAVSGENYIQLNASTIVPDLTRQRVNCLHISDSVIFWTNSNSENDFNELISVCHSFYWRSLQTTFPLRGCLTYGEIDFNPDRIQNPGGTFYNYSLIGKGLVNAYLKAESLEYAGCLLDSIVVDRIGEGVINRLLTEQKICIYKVPFKTGMSYEHVFRPVHGNHNDQSFRNTAIGIKRLFTYASKTAIDKMPESVKNKMNNTIDFIGSFKVSGNE